MPYKVWAIGEETLATDFNDYVQEQVVATFPNAAARTSGLAAPNPGQITYLVDVQRHEWWNGSAWIRTGVGGEVGHAQLVANTGSFAASPGGAIAGLSVTVACVPGRRYYVELWGTLNSAQDAVAYLDTLLDGVSATPIARVSMYGQRNAAGGENRSVSTRARYSVATAGTHTFSAWGIAQAGATYIQASAQNPTMLTVLDMGPL